MFIIIVVEATRGEFAAKDYAGASIRFRLLVRWKCERLLLCLLQKRARRIRRSFPRDSPFKTLATAIKYVGSPSHRSFRFECVNF